MDKMLGFSMALCNEVTKYYCLNYLPSGLGGLLLLLAIFEKSITATDDGIGMVITMPLAAW